MDREVRAGGIPPAPALPTHMPVQKMGPQDDPEAFLDLFEKTAEACGCPQMNWPVRLIPLLTREAQLAAQQLPVQNLLAYDDLKRAILQRVGRNPEQHRQRFRSLELGENGRPFVMAHQLRDACRRWLLAGEGGVDQIIDRAGTIHCVVTQEDCAVGPVPPPGVAGPGHPTRGGSDGGVPRGWRNPALHLSLSLSPLLLFLPLNFFLGPVPALYPGPCPDEGEVRHQSQRP